MREPDDQRLPASQGVGPDAPPRDGALTLGRAARPAPGAPAPAADLLGDALSDSYRHLAMRDRTEAEIRSALARRGHDPEVAEEAVEELRRQGYLDDARFARRFAEDRRRLDGWGSERIRARLAELGVPAQLADAAGASAPEEELAAAVDLLRRRLPHVPSSERERQRALGLLVRRGFELELAYDAVRSLERDAA